MISRLSLADNPARTRNCGHRRAGSAVWAIADSYGHQAGDEVLRVTASRLLQYVRKADTAARLGGDEFVVLVQDLPDFKAAEWIAANIVKSLGIPIPVDGRELPVSVSVGVCTSNAEVCDGNDLLKNADAALYVAKTSGRNRFRIYKPNPTPIPTGSQTTTESS